MFNTEAPLNDSEFNKFRKLIYEIAGISLSDRKRELVKSRLARRLRAHDLSSYADYYELLRDPQRSAGEIENFTNALTTNKTEFFREAHHFDYLRNELFPTLRQATLAGREKKLRIWCAASSTGQEPYTLAMTILDYFGPQSDWDLRLLASDIDTQVLATAMAGLYNESDMEGISNGLRTKHFLRETRGDDPTWRAKPELKQLITFRQINLNDANWPINTVFDAIFCRNVMIYFDHQTQVRLVERFAQYLVPGGLLVIGHSESLFSITDQFESIGDTIYKLKAGVTPSPRRTAHPVVANVASAKPVPTKPSTVKTTTPSPIAVQRIGTPLKMQHMARVPASAVGATRADEGESLSLPTRVLVVGEYEAAREECLLQTVLGSCVSACLYDPTNRLGGMNHFMLPEALERDEVSATYGVHAMELLINAIMKLGGSRRHLIAKVFGGARVIQNFKHSVDVGQRNVDFVKAFLQTEGIPIVAEHVLGQFGRRVKLIPTTGKVYVKLLNQTQSIDADAEQRADGQRAWAASQAGVDSKVTLF